MKNLKKEKILRKKPKDEVDKKADLLIEKERTITDASEEREKLNEGNNKLISKSDKKKRRSKNVKQ